VAGGSGGGGGSSRSEEEEKVDKDIFYPNQLLCQNMKILL